MSMFWPLFGVGAAIFLCGVAGGMSGRLKTYQANGVYAVGNFAFVIAGVSEHQWLGPMINSASGAVSAWMWWKGGGGDDTKRRLRKLSRSFTGTRRTAPAGA